MKNLDSVIMGLMDYAPLSAVDLSAEISEFTGAAVSVKAITDALTRLEEQDLIKRIHTNQEDLYQLNN